MLFKNNISENGKARNIPKEEAIYKFVLVTSLSFLTLPGCILCSICWFYGVALGEKLAAIIEKLI